MKRNDPLHELICSLSKNEKRFFRLQTGITSGDKNYLHVFNVMERMGEYDDTLLKKKLAVHRFNLSYEKNYLHKQLMKSLRIFYTDSSIDGRMDAQLRDIEILMNKRLFGQAGRQLAKAREYAMEHEFFPHLLNLLRLQSRLALRMDDHGYQYNMLTFQLQEEKQAMRKYEELITMRALQSRLLAIIQTQGIASGKALKEMDKVMRSPLLKGKPRHMAFITQVHYHEAWGFYHMQKRQYEKAYASGHELVALFERSPAKQQSLPQGYFASLNALGTRCLLLRKDKEALEVIGKIQGVLKMKSGINENLRLEINLSVFEKQLLFHVYTHQFQEGIKVSGAMEKYFRGKEDKTRKSAVIFQRYYTAWTYFAMGQNKKALEYVNRILNEKSLDIRFDLITEAQLLNLMIHFELGNFELIHSTISSTQRFLKQNGIELRSADLILRMFSELIRVSGDRSRTREIFQRSEKELQRLTKTLSEKMLMDSLEVIEWIRLKVG